MFETKTYEDRWAVTLIDTYNQLSTVAVGSLEREIHVFGELFDQGILLKGIIDQVQYSKTTGELTILDYKTRRTNTMPSAAQKLGHALQLMLYKCMLDSLTCGITKMNLLAEHLNLNFQRPLTQGVLEHVGRCGMQSLFTTSDTTAADVGRGTSTMCSAIDGGSTFKLTLGELAKKISELIVGLNLPLVSSLMVQYVYQQTREEIGMEVVEYDEAWARRAFEDFTGVLAREARTSWSGSRGTCGSATAVNSETCVSGEDRKLSSNHPWPPDLVISNFDQCIINFFWFHVLQSS